MCAFKSVSLKVHREERKKDIAGCILREMEREKERAKEREREKVREGCGWEGRERGG